MPRSFWVEPATPALGGVKPAGFDGGAVFSGISSPTGAAAGNVPPATTPATVAAAVNGPWPQIWPFVQNGAVDGEFRAVLLPPGSTAVTSQVLATAVAATLRLTAPVASVTPTTTLPGIGPVSWVAATSVPARVSRKPDGGTTKPGGARGGRGHTRAPPRSGPADGAAGDDVGSRHSDSLTPGERHEGADRRARGADLATRGADLQRQREVVLDDDVRHDVGRRARGRGNQRDVVRVRGVVRLERLVHHGHRRAGGHVGKAPAADVAAQRGAGQVVHARGGRWRGRGDDVGRGAHRACQRGQ